MFGQTTERLSPWEEDSQPGGPETRDIPPLLVASIRYRGKLDEAGLCIGIILRKLGEHAAGRPTLLHHNCHFSETAADLEACIPVREALPLDGITYRTLGAGQCLSLTYHGAYSGLGRTYEALFTHLKRNGMIWRLPFRNIYHRGSGLHQRRESAKNRTEVQIFFDFPQKNTIEG